MDIEDAQIGLRVRELREWRGMTVTAVAGLAGMSKQYLSMIELGDRAVTKRSVLEALATALRVSPTDLDGRQHSPVSPTSTAAHAALDGLEAALTEWWPGEVPDDRPARPWGQVAAELDTLTRDLRPRADFDQQGAILPGLLHDLLTYAADDDHRADALVGLIAVYHASGNMASWLGARHLGLVAAERIQAAAETLGDAEWLGVATWARAQFMSSMSRPRQYKLALAAADAPGARLESRGMGHLTAALATAAQGDQETAETHLAEADRMADHLDAPQSTWGHYTLNFGKPNTGVWRISIGVELGYGGRVAEIAKTFDWRDLPVSRRGAYWMDLGRALVQEKRTRDEGLRALLKAEELTPHQVRSNVFVREAVAGLLAWARRDAGGRDLRGLAYRMGVAPSG
ncbi:MAG: helix-turn-helix transcriptional regulator [Actinophytocola sp.]|uniref:helix-turn-helix domain-containing protein n=1 Tax=Actinophytocola sp. TaxID=1872138 RepID=UPI003C781207